VPAGPCGLDQQRVNRCTQATDGHMTDCDAPLGQQLHIPRRDCVPQLPTHRYHDHIRRKPDPPAKMRMVFHATGPRRGQRRRDAANARSLASPSNRGVHLRQRPGHRPIPARGPRPRSPLDHRHPVPRRRRDRPSPVVITATFIGYSPPDCPVRWWPPSRSSLCLALPPLPAQQPRKIAGHGSRTASPPPHAITVRPCTPSWST
jgi:hypothetical protein